MTVVSKSKPLLKIPRERLKRSEIALPLVGS
jgi:hypothetical protein